MVRPGCPLVLQLPNSDTKGMTLNRFDNKESV